MKKLIRTILNFLHLDLTKNLEYDRLTKLVLKKALKPNFNAVDVGCHKGEILEDILRYAPKGHHYAFEPIPSLFSKLQKKYSPKTTILPYALSDKEGKTTFNYVKNAPAYSGLNKREYAIENPAIEKIEVTIHLLDNLIPEDVKIDLIKIDVEGAEMGVLKGAKRILKKDKPLLIFECGLGASDFYDLSPDELFTYLTKDIGLGLYTLKGWLGKRNPITKTEFITFYESNSEYYFIASV